MALFLHFRIESRPPRPILVFLDSPDIQGYQTDAQNSKAAEPNYPVEDGASLAQTLAEMPADNALTRDPSPSAPKRLFILRPDHLGDLVLFSGALRRLRAQWPAAHITLCVRAYGLELFASCPYVDRLFPYEELAKAWPINRIPAFPGYRRVGRALDACFGGWLRKRLYREVPFLSTLECDLAVSPSRSPFEEYHPLMRLVPAARRLGISGSTANQSRGSDAASRRCYSAQLEGSKWAWDLPELETSRQFLSFMGVEASAEDLWPELWTKAEDQQAAEKLMNRPAQGLTLGIAPGNALPGKILPPGWYAGALAGLKGEPLQVVLLGGPGDAEICEGIQRAVESLDTVAHVLNLAGKTTIRQMIACIGRCDLMLAQETAAVHIATALRKPVAGIIGGGHYGRFYPWGDPNLARVVNKTMDCYGCHWHCKYETMRCIQEIPPAAAALELNGLLEAVRRANTNAGTARGR